MIKKEFDNLTHKIPYYAYHKGVCLLSDGALFCGIKLSHLDSLSITDQSASTIKARFKTVFDDLPVGYVVQVFHDFHTDNRQEIAEIENRLNSQHPVAIEYKTSYLNHLRQDDSLRKVDLYVFIIAPNRKRLADVGEQITRIAKRILNFRKKERLPSKEENLVQIMEAKSAELRNNTERVVTAFEGNLGIGARLIDETELNTLIYKILNPGKDFFRKGQRKTNGEVHPNYFSKYITMREFLTHTGGGETASFIQLGDKFLTVLTLKVPSDSTDSFQAENILERIPFPFIWSYNFTILDTSAKNDQLAAKQRRKHAFTASSTNPNMNSTVSKSEVEQALVDQFQFKFKWHDVSLSFVITADTEKELKDKSAYLIGVFRDFQESALVEEEYALQDYFIASLPGCGHLNDRKYLQSSRNVSDLVPVSAPPTGTTGLSCYLHTERNTLFRFSMFSDEFLDFNHVVIGKIGSGKSFIVNNILTLSLMGMKHPRVMILDLGQSFKRTTELWGGQYVTIDLNNPDSGLNPLPPRTMLMENGEKNLDVLDFTIQLILVMAQPKSKSCDALQARVVRQALEETYERVESEPLMSDLVESLVKFSTFSNDKEDIAIASRLSKYLDAYVGDGPYAKIFNRHSSLNLTSDFFCFDFKNASQNEDIREIATYVIGGYISRKMVENAEPKIIIFDEFASTMKHETGATLCKMIAKNCRKHGTSFICISQQIEDFISDEDNVAKTVYNQSNFKWFLKLDDNLYKNKEHLKFTPVDIDIISNLTTVKGSYSETYLIYNDKKARLRLRPDPLTYWSCTMDAKDRLMAAKYFSYFQDQKTQLEILKKLALAHPYGVHCEHEDMVQDEIYRAVQNNQRLINSSPIQNTITENLEESNQLLTGGALCSGNYS